MRKAMLIALCTAIALPALASIPPPLRGFSYQQEVAPTGREWENPEAYALNKEQPRAHFFSFASVASAARVLPEHSEYYLSLDGTWQFHWVGNPSERPVDFYKTNFDASSWAKVPVPMCWNVYGLQKDGRQKYGTPIYVNQPAIFYHERKIDDWRGGVMRTPPTDWTTYKHRNEVGSYRRTFTVPQAWDGHEIYINFDGVDSFFYLWINGQYVGFSKNSRNLAAFDITSYLRRGENLVAVEVYRSSDGSFLETQDMFRLPGIIRSVSLTAKPKLHIRDLQVIPNLDEQYRHGELNITAELRNHTGRGIKPHSIDYWLYALPLYSDQATLVRGAHAHSSINKLEAGGSERYRTTLKLEYPKLWSAEAPYRYVLVAELKNAKGQTIEIVSTYTGFREVEIKDTKAEDDEFGLAGRYFYINGRPTKLKGVNRHETHPTTGHVLTYEQMEQEVMLMKRANINHVRNSHYPTHPYFYYLCDKYGIYLEDEANIESHLYYYGKESLSHVPEFEAAHINRMLEMVRANINSPSIVIWSLGNEAGPGKTFVKCYDQTKLIDTSRPIQYERNNDIVDMGSNQYPSISWVRDAVKGGYNIKYPFHISEYAHSMGNAVGGLQDYWEAIESTNFFCGGAIWDWVDQSLYNYTPEGLRYMAYGGDFGDKPNDGMFVMNGIIFADRTPKPQYYEVQKVYQYIGIEAEDIRSGRVQIFNKNYYTDLSAYELHWSLWEGGLSVQRGSLPMPKVAPRTKAKATIPFRLNLLKPQHEYFLKVECKLKEDMPWAKAGFTQAREQLLVQSPSHRQTLAEVSGGATLKLISQPSPTVVGRNFEVAFDAQQGTIHKLTYDGQTMIEAGNGPKLSTFRAPCDNDIWAWGAWGNHGLHNLKHRVLYTSSYLRADGAAVVVFGVESQAPNAAKLYDRRASGRYQVEEQTDKPFSEEDFKINTNQVWTIYPDGSIELQSNITSNLESLALGRLGFEVIVPKRYDTYSYYGRGPINNYSDRKTGQFIEIHQSKVIDQFVSFPKPQTMGNREDVRWAALTDGSGAGLLFVAGDKMSTSALPWSALELTKAPHPHELPSAGDTHLHLDASVNGLGGFSCGQGPPLKHCQSFATPQSFSFAIRPLQSADEIFNKAQIQLSGDRLPLLARDLQGRVQIKEQQTGKLMYSIGKGKPQAYTDPVDLAQGGNIKIWYADNPKLYALSQYPKLATQLSVLFVSSEEVHQGFDAGKLLDGDPNTIWHSTYTVTVGKFPHWIDFDAHTPVVLKGFHWLPRKHYVNGDIKDYSLSVSLDAKEWREVARGSFDEDKTLKKVMLDKPVKARYIRFTCLSAHNGQDSAAAAEFKVITD